MGVDVSSFVGYGDFFDSIILRGDYLDGSSRLFWINEDEELCYNYEVADNRGLLIKVDPYSYMWCFIGIQFIGQTLEDTIKNLKNVENKWKELIKELKEAIPEGDSYSKLHEEIDNLKPEIVEHAYFS